MVRTIFIHEPSVKIIIDIASYQIFDTDDWRTTKYITKRNTKTKFLTT